MSLVEEGLAGPSVFRHDPERPHDSGERTLDFNYVPTELPHRDEEMRRLASLFRGVAQGATTQQVLITGPVGSGKTVLAKRFGKDLATAMGKAHRDLKVAYVNCRNDRTASLVMVSILKHLDTAFPERGFSVPEMLDALEKRIVAKETHLLLLLDEADVLVTASSDLFYSLSRFGSGKSEAKLSFIAIAQRDILPLLDEATASTFAKANAIRLGPYAQPAMRAIVDQRIRLAFHPGTFRDDVAELVADIGAEKGDARRAIEVLRAAGTNADDEGRDHVTPEDVRTAKANIHSELPSFKLRELPMHEAIMLLAIAERLKRSEAAFAISGEVHDTYRLLAEEFGEEARGHTQCWLYLKNLAAYGFISLKPSGEGQSGRTQLVSLPDVPARQFSDDLRTLIATVHRKGH